MTTQPELLPDEVWVGRHPEGGDLTVLGPECYIPPNEKRVKYTRVTPPAEAQGDVVAALERARDEACSCKGSMGRCIIHECYDDCISVVKAALHQPTEDEAMEIAKKALNAVLERVAYDDHTSICLAIVRALNRPVGGEK